jgi:pyruvate dehydrogenase E1 component alpha subunit
MQRIRQFEQAIQSTELEGHLSIGQEGTIAGACFGLRDDDYITGTHRSHGHAIAKGADLKPLMAELYGRVTGICKGRGGSMHLADRRVGIIGESAIVGGGIPLATGAGLSIKIRGTEQVCLCFFGDGAANQGTFGESLNLAAIWKLPVIFLCENNGYAITTSIAKSHGQPDIAKRADGYGLPGVIVDGQVAESVYDVTADAISRARAGEGPTLIEAKTYRFDEHCRNLGVPIPYRSQAEVAAYRSERDPIALYRALLKDRGIPEQVIGAIERDAAEAVSEAVRFGQESPYPEFADVFENMFSMPIQYPAKTKRLG